jgi:hypothetical protein
MSTQPGPCASASSQAHPPAATPRPPLCPAATIWAPYAKYTQVDKLYGREGYDAFVAGKEGFNVSQSVMNLVEVALQLTFLHLVRKRSPAAALVGFAVALMTLSKTVLYFMIEAATGHANTRHNSGLDYALAYLLPNSLWILVPSAIVYTLGGAILKKLGAK